MTELTLDDVFRKYKKEPGSEEAARILSKLERNITPVTPLDLDFVLRSTVLESAEVSNQPSPKLNAELKHQPVKENPSYLNLREALKYVGERVRHIDALMVVANADCKEERGDYLYEPKDLDLAIKVCTRRE